MGTLAMIACLWSIDAIMVGFGVDVYNTDDWELGEKDQGGEVVPKLREGESQQGSVDND